MSVFEDKVLLLDPLELTIVNLQVRPFIREIYHVRVPYALPPRAHLIMS